MKWFGLGAIKPAQAIQEEIDALDGRIEELTAQLTDVEQKLCQARDNEQGVQKTIGELQRHQQDAERGLVLVQGAVAAARTKASDKNVSAMEICAGEIRWHNGLLEQLWHIYYFGPTGAVEKTLEEWLLVPKFQETAIAEHIHPLRAAA